MPKRCEAGLTKTTSGYSRTIGYYTSKGRRVPRKFHLGHDRSLAKRKVDVLEDAWERLPGERGQKVWTEEAITAALATVTTVLSDPPTAAAEAVTTPLPVFTPRSAPKPTPARTYTLPEALDEFTRFFDQRTDISQAHRDGTKSRINSVKRHIEELSAVGPDGVTVYLKDLPVSAVDMEWLGRMRNKITSRPLTNHVYDTPKPISLDCVKNWLMALAMAFDWFDRTPRLGWLPPHHRWRENFVLSKKQEYALSTPEERDEEGKPKPAYTIDELATVYKRSSPLAKKYLLMGLMLGWSQEAIKSFRRCHLVTMNGEYYIDRRRGKTGVQGYWWVCPELAEMLIRSISKTPANTDDLAFLTEEGLPLVHGKTDTIRLTWERTLNGSPKSVRRLPFGRVKKCGAQVIENLGGHELAQLFLAHRPATVAAGHYTGRDVKVGIGKTPYERLHDVQREMYEKLKPVLFGTGQRPQTLAESQGEGEGRSIPRPADPQADSECVSVRSYSPSFRNFLRNFGKRSCWSKVGSAVGSLR